MKFITPLLLLLLLKLSAFVSASELELRDIYLPLYHEFAVLGEEQENLHKQPVTLRFMSRGANPETKLGLLNKPFIPQHDSTWQKPTDINLISLCKLSVDYVTEQNPDGTNSLQIILDQSEFVLPEQVSLTQEEVINLVKQAIKQNFPSAILLIKDQQPEPAQALFALETGPTKASILTGKNERAHPELVDKFGWVWGTDGHNPEVKIQEISLEVDGHRIAIPEIVYADLFEIQGNSAKLFLLEENIQLLSFSAGDAAGSYQANLLFKNGIFFERYLFNPKVDGYFKESLADLKKEQKRPHLRDREAIEKPEILKTEN